ncbi:YdcF family protein [Modestobacter sp. I12A-02628]|uniref:YdcF family protein n=2 Tax=Goekera deserti TaxID=2497753 RepID=A0A7K3WDN3_9ACTN|nr:YdcF family protein [Goekera deserti]NDI47875.1 YdcF family protein [Goekera deserti]NEL53623.1 YdcF family protein [Goekera deserti]
MVGATATAIWWTARQDDRPRSDAIVVLGSAQYNGVPSSIFEARLEHALALYEQGVAPVVVTVGGKAAGDAFTEADAGREYLATAGVPDDDLLAVPEGVDTLESMQVVADAFTERGWRTAVLVTDPWHAMRAERMATDSGLEATSSPTRQGPAVQTRGTQARYIFRETAAYLVYRVTGASVAGAPGVG